MSKKLTELKKWNEVLKLYFLGGEGSVILKSITILTRFTSDFPESTIHNPNFFLINKDGHGKNGNRRYRFFLKKFIFYFFIYFFELHSR